MQFKLRPVPFVISLVLSATVLFGGWFMYHSYAMETPLHELVQDQTGVKTVSSEIKNDKVTIYLELTSEASLREIYGTILKDGSSIIGNRAIDLKVMNESSPELESLWSGLLFDIAEAMEQKQYSRIPALLEGAASNESGLSYGAEMDADHVYIKLVLGDHSKYLILPRTSAKMGVWPNE
jgi:hypothetical protein